MTASITGEVALPARDPGNAPLISLVIPTFNEAGNIAELLAQLARAVPEEVPCEVIFMDDSTDDTPGVIAETARNCRLPVSVRHRDTPDGGLGGAVAAGLQMASAPWIVVMDADLQHPPALVPELVAAGRKARAELVIATRYAAGGSGPGRTSRSPPGTLPEAAARGLTAASACSPRKRPRCSPRSRSGASCAASAIR